MTSKTLLLAGVVACGVVACRPKAPPLSPAPALGRASLSGQVRAGRRGAPLPQVIIRLTDRTGAVRDSTVSDAVGRFTFRDLAPEWYRLAFVRIGFEGQLLNVQLAAGEHVQRRIALRASSIGMHADCLGPDGQSMGAQYCR